MKYYLSLFLLMTAATSNAAIVDNFNCSVLGAGTIPLNANASISIPRQPINSAPEAGYQRAEGSGYVNATNVNSTGIEMGITLGLNINYLMQTDSTGKLIRAGEFICMGPSWQLGNQSNATSCAGSSSSGGSDPFFGYTDMSIQHGVAYFVPTGALNWTGTLDGYGKVALSCSFQSTLE